MKMLGALLLIVIGFVLAFVVIDRLTPGDLLADIRQSDFVRDLTERVGIAPAPEPEPEAAVPAGPIVVGGFATPESVVFDAEWDRYLVASVGAFGPANDGFIATLYPDGSVQDMDFIRGTDAAPLNNALGTAIYDGWLYVADSPFVRAYDLETGGHIASYEVPGAGLLNDVAVDDEGAVYVTDMGTEDPASWAVHLITPDGAVSEFARGADLARPNGIEIDALGRVVVTGVASPLLVMISPLDGLVEQTITLPDGGYDGLVVLQNAYIVSDPFAPAIYRVGMDGISTLIDSEIASPASLGYDHTRNRLLIPQLQANTVTILQLD
jgi:hypothetical protein